MAWRLGLLLAAGNLLLIGVGLSANNPRRGSNWNLMFALLAFIAYFNLINLSQAWVGSGRFALGPTMAMLHGGVLLIGACLLWWRDHGSVRRWLSWRVAT